jgi:hypothetical protein
MFLTGGSGGGGGSGSGETLIAETIVTVAAATVDFDTVFTDSYERYRIEIIGVLPVTGDEHLNMRVRSGGSYQATLYEYRTDAQSAGTGSSDVKNSASAAEATVLGSDGANFGLNDAAAGGGYLDLIVAQPSNVSKYVQWWGRGHFQNEPSGGGLERAVINKAWGEWKSAAAVTGIQFFFDTGNVAGGIFRVWGMPNS